jgi:chemotaxis protein methyltransferase CheR
MEGFIGGSRTELETLEMELLLEAIFRKSGFDFRGYAPAGLKRRLMRRVHEEGLESLSGLQEQVLHEPRALERLLVDLAVNVTSMFRDPSFFVAFRQKAVPLLRTYPFVRLWHAGCSTGEEVFSMAILLKEEGLHERARIYATDMNEAVLDRAESAVMPISKMKDYTQNYIKAGGKRSFSEYYKVDGRVARLDRDLLKNVVLAQHNLVSDRSFNEFNVIMCRNVMIYFGRSLQSHVHSLLYESLGMFGVLALGHRESMRFTDHASHYEELDPEQKLYRKVA